MGRKPKDQKESEILENQELNISEKIEKKEENKDSDKATNMLREIEKLESDLKSKKKEYSEYIATQRKETKQLSVSECLKLAMRDDLNSDRRELRKITGIALDKLKRTK